MENKKMVLVELNSSVAGYRVLDKIFQESGFEVITAGPSGLGRFFIWLDINNQNLLGKVEKILAEEPVGCVHDFRSMTKVSETVKNGFFHMNKAGEKGPVLLVEAASTPAAVLAASLAVQSSDVRVIDIQQGRSLGGHTLAILTGKIDSLKASKEKAVQEFRADSTLVGIELLEQPSSRVLEFFFLT